MRICEFDNEEEKLTWKDLKNVEEFAEKVLKGIDVAFANHFLERVNDKRNKNQITLEELFRIFRETAQLHNNKIKKLGYENLNTNKKNTSVDPKNQKKHNPNNPEGIIKDLQQNLNLPFILKWDRKKQKLVLLAKTIMRKKKFKSTNPEFVI